MGEDKINPEQTLKTIVRQITSVPEDSGYEVVKPINVELTYDDGVFDARAPELGILVAGNGLTPEEAVANLTEIVLDHADAFSGIRQVDYVGYALEVKKRVFEHLKHYL